MKKQRLYSYVTLAAIMGLWSCSSSRQTAQNTSEADDLYGSSGNAAVYASNSSDYGSVATPNARSQRSSRQQRSANANPDYNDEQYGAASSANTEDYYTELSARKLNRGLSPDPGWSDDGTNAYNSGFVNGYNAATTSAYSWNRWGFNNTGFYSGLGMGLGMGGFGYNSFRFGFGSPFYSPFYGNSFAYSPFGYDSFYNPYGFGGYGGFGNSFYSPFNGYYGNNYYGGFYGNPVYVNNGYVTGADPYRNRTYVRTNERSAGRYSSAFDNSARTYNPNGGRTGANSAGTPSSRGDNGYYARPSTGSNRGSYYYDNSSSGRGRTSAPATAPSYNSNPGTSNSNSEYYARPRQSNRGSYTPPAQYNGGRSSAQPSYQQPSYENNRGSYQQQSQSQPSYSAPSRSYSAPSAPSYSAPSSGGGAPSGGGRGPR